MRIKKGIYLVLGEENCTKHALETVVLGALKGGVSLVQLREKTASTREFLAKANALKALLEPFHVPLIINDRLDIALAVNADGVHLGQSDMPYAEARSLLGSKKIIGLSVESMAQARAAEKLDIDYLALSPIYSTLTKTDTKIEWGLDGLKNIRQMSRHKLVAIGGLNADNLADVFEAGADWVSVVSAIAASTAPEASAKALCEIANAHFSRTSGA